MTQQEAVATGTTVLRAQTGEDESPRGETEAAIASLFAEMLGIAGLPRTASVFDLGLDSLSVTVACARLEQATGVQIRFSQLFRTPSVAQLAAWIDGARDEADGERREPAATALRPADELVAITPMQAETVPQHILVKIAWWFDGPVDDEALENAVNDIHLRHQALHAKYLDGPDLGLAEVPADPRRVQFHRLGQADDEAAASAVLWETLRQPLRLGQGEVWRCALVRTRPDGRTLFGLIVDHTGFDGRSWDILTAELPVAYAARVAGKAPHWPGRTASLAEMAADFRHQLALADIDAQRRYWRHELTELPACRLAPPTDGPAEAIPVRPGARFSSPGPATARSFTVPHAQLRPWEDYAHANGMATSVGIAAAYMTAIIRAGASPDFAVTVPIANNAGEVIDRTITTRVGNIVLRPNNPSRSGHILARMRDAYHHAMAARDVLVDPKELAGVLGGEGSDGIVHLDRMACLSYNSVPNLVLGGIAGSLAFETGGELRIPFPVRLQVVPVPEGLLMELSLRTDLSEAGTADLIRQHLLAVIGDGPERLELQAPH
jgi:acyl carrier protein